ncbi:hypothetical protein CMI37_12880 [Candidatus Pacearchaeota archaeon]|jgi:hypothetical protein|nr:hypothetical protein [Candidatus Pacearchaeota archaeon]|tara:strand:- start:3981 stop:4244 length:264 start_codon:yes stop_codon:yes gene_type:complete
MESQFSILGTTDRTNAMSVIQDYAETTHFPEKLDEIIHHLLQQQMIHTLHEITDKILHCGYVIDQVKHIAIELSETHSYDYPLTSII